MKILYLILSIIIFIANINVFAIEENFNDIKIAVVNPIEVYKKTPQGEKSMHELHASFQSNIDDLNLKQKELIFKINKFKDEYSLLSQEEINNKKKILQLEEENFKQQVSDFRNFEIYHEQRLASIFQEQFLESTKNLAQINFYDIIININALIYISPKINIDITDKVIKNMNDNF